MNIQQQLVEHWSRIPCAGEIFDHWTAIKALQLRAIAATAQMRPTGFSGDVAEALDAIVELKAVKCDLDAHGEALVKSGRLPTPEGALALRDGLAEVRARMTDVVTKLELAIAGSAPQAEGHDSSAPAV